MFDNTTFTLAAAVANNGTVTVGYPTGRSQGNYDWAPAHHTLYVNGNRYNAPADFTLTFNVNASSITLTNVSGAAWPAGATCRLGIERAGPSDFNALHRTADTTRTRQLPVGLHVLNLGSPNILDADGFCASQDLTAAGVFSVSVTAAAAIAAAALAGICDVPRNVVAAWTGTAVITITGTDEYGGVIVEKSASGTSLTGKKAFKTVTGIAVSANVTSLTVGTGDVLGLPVAVPKLGMIFRELKNGVALAPGGSGKTVVQGLILEAEVDAGTNLELVSPVAGVISLMQTIVQGTVTTGGAVTLNVATVAVNGLSVVIADGAVDGEIDSDAPTAEHATAVVAVGDRLSVVFAAGFNASADIAVNITIDTTQATAGTFVAAVGAEATATTGDVRGTYDPVDALDGDDGYMLIVMLADGTDKGVAQYAG